MNRSGYYLISDETKPNILFYCNDNDCQSINKNNLNGFFINEYKLDYIKCLKGFCEIFSLGNTCLNNMNEIIKNYNELAYCSKSFQRVFDYGLIKNPEYYLLEDININFHYPEFKFGNDTILLKMDRYSVQHFITDDNGNIF